MTAQSLVARIDAILGQPSPVDSFTTFATCRDCGGPFTVDRITSTRQTRKAHLTCSACGEPAVLTVTLARPVTAERADSAGPHLPYQPLERHLGTRAEDAADVLGVTARTIYRWRHDGIPLDHAENSADRLGLHPTGIWGHTYLVATGTGEAVA